MYYGYAASTLSLRAKPSLSHYRRLLDDGGGDELPLRGLSINPRFLLYGYYLRQSSLIYWSPLRTFLAGHGGHQYYQLSVRDDVPCAPRLSTRRGECRTCCCCRSSQRSLRIVGECYRGRFGDRIWEDEADCDEYGHTRRYSKREVEIRSNDGEKVRSLRERKDGSSLVCPSCGHETKPSGGRKVGRELSQSSSGQKDNDGTKVNAAARKVREVWKIEDDDVGYDSSEDTDYRDRDYNVSVTSSTRVSNRKARGRETKLIGSAHQEEAAHHFYNKDEVEIRGSRGKSRNYARISGVDANRDVSSSSKNVVDLRKVDTNTSSVKQHGEVDQRVVEGDKQELNRRVRNGASWSVSAHGRRDEDCHGRQNIVEKDSREGSREHVSVSDVHEDDRRMASRSNRFVDERKVDMAESSTSTLKQHRQVDKRVVGQAALITDVSEEYLHNDDQVARQRESREGSRRFARISELHADNAERISSLEDMLEKRKVDKEHSSTSILKQHTAIDQQAVGSYESREHLQNLRQIEEVHRSNIQRASNIERHEEIYVKNRDDKSTSVNIASVLRDQVDQQIIDKKELGKLYENRADVSRLHERGTKNASSSRSLLQSRIDDRVDSSTSTVKLVHQAGKNQIQSGGQYNQQSSSRRESGKNTLSRKDTGRVSTTQVIYNPDIQNELDDRQYSSRRESEVDTRISEYSMTDIQRSSNSQEISNSRIGNRKESSSLLLLQDETKKLSTPTGESSRPTNQEITFTGTLDSGSSSLYTHMQRLDGQTSRDEMYLAKGDTLDSASRLESSSAMYVGEFVDKLRQETSNFKISSGTQTEETHGKDKQATMPMQSGRLDVTTKDKDDKYVQEGSRRSSSRSGMKGPSDEMWDVRSPISQEDSRTEELGEDGLSASVVDSTTTTPTAENIVAQRSPKSLWAHIADIIRMGWVHRAESRTSTRKSGKRSSSEGSEAWFSGQDASDDENNRNGRSSDLKELLPVGGHIDQGHETHSSITQGSFKAPNVVVMQLGSSVSTSLGIRGGYASMGASIDSRPEDIALAENEKGTKNIASSTLTVDQPPSLTGDAPSVTIDEGLTNTGNPALPVSGYMKLEEDLAREELPEVGKTEGEDGELKRRKLQRNKQVLKETFEEWEEAYRLESEQRKIDEFFMREALVEAQKAADIWEVPVGAVLVQNGKIIARGFNLVEEKRDSTAHAEMICIREASNLLRTWRLAETTLYVTLEPCPMCAGAILQARIDTVVWGAPNKLLGADGSWVRLFPGDGGSNSLDPSDQVAGPVHPFHPKIRIRRGVLATECSDVLQQFFQLRRRKKKKPESPPQSCLPVPNHAIKLFSKMPHIFSIMFCL